MEDEIKIYQTNCDSLIEELNSNGNNNSKKSERYTSIIGKYTNFRTYFEEFIKILDGFFSNKSQNPETEEFEILAEMDGSFIVTPLSFDQDSLLYFTLGQVTTTGEQNNNVCTYNTFTNAITIVYSAPNVISPQLINVFGYPNNRFVLISKTIEVPTITKLSVIDVSSQSETLLFELSNNNNINVKLFGNKLISVTDNAIFEIDIATNQLDTLYLLSSPGEFPQFPKFCISPDSIIYGIAFLGPYLPTLYSFDLKINQFNILTDYNIGGYEYLSQSNFNRIKTTWDGGIWGDALYIKTKEILKFQNTKHYTKMNNPFNFFDKIYIE
jgi:hypothetical protein